ncbi:MAG: hypothetical protein ACYS8K_09040 [Planctomycetota bacterium]|jgi:hypothetical protein
MRAKVLMLALDAPMPNLVERFEREGLIPNLSRLMCEGCFTRLLSASRIRRRPTGIPSRPGQRPGVTA